MTQHIFHFLFNLDFVTNYLIKNYKVEFRTKEAAKTQYLQTCYAEIRSQRQHVDKLTKENRNLKQDLADARDATADSGANAMGMRQMAIHTKKCEQTASELDKFAQKKMDIDKMVAQAQAQMKECRTTMARKGG